MSLDFSFAKIANFKAVCYETDPNRPETNRITPVTETLIYGTMLTGIGELKTDADCIAYADRIAAYEKLYGTFLHSVPAADDSITPRPITLADVRAHLGLRTNVFPRESDAKFTAKLWKGWQGAQRRDRQRQTDRERHTTQEQVTEVAS